MSSEGDLSCARAGDLALLLDSRQRTKLVRLEAGQTTHTHHGVLPHDNLIGRPWGSRVTSHTGQPYLLLAPSLHDLVVHIKRITQIIYPKEAGYILLKMSVGPGSRVIEAGTGSGGLTLVLAHAVRPTGRVYSYENRPEMQQLAQRNLARVGLSDVVEFKLRDVAEGFEEHGVDALFLDMVNPWDYLQQAHAALVNGGVLGAILPTTNQVAHLLAALEELPFGLVEVEEIMLRPYKPVAGRFRPADRMIAHTGFLIFARALVPPPVPIPGTTDGTDSIEDTGCPAQSEQPIQSVQSAESV